MTIIATCEQGSSSSRTTVFETSGDNFKEKASRREKTRLGDTVFEDATIPRDKRHEILDAFEAFRDKVWKPKGVEYVHAVATSAAREARGKDWVKLQRKILHRTGVFIPTITPEHEALLVRKAVTHELALKGDKTLTTGRTCILDVGGGSIQATLVERGIVIGRPMSLPLGTIRLLKLESEHPKDRERLLAEIRRELRPLVRELQRGEESETGLQVITTGGNSRALSEYIASWKGRDNLNQLTRDELKLVGAILPTVPLQSRTQHLGLKEMRRDVIVPAALVLGELLDMLKVNELRVSRLGVRYGLMLEALDLLPKRGTTLERDIVVEHAHTLIERMGLDRAASERLADITMRLFDDPELRKMHKLGPEARILLEATALMQDIGNIFKDPDDYHKDSLRILASILFGGLDHRQQMIVANVARYHRGALPDDKHDEFKQLSEQDRKTVVKLSAILRLANALQGKAKNNSVIVLAFDQRDDDLLLRPRGLEHGFRKAVRDVRRSFEIAFNVGLVAEKAA